MSQTVIRIGARNLIRVGMNEIEIQIKANLSKSGISANRLAGRAIYYEVKAWLSHDKKKVSWLSSPSDLSKTSTGVQN